jgi:putative transposase
MEFSRDLTGTTGIKKSRYTEEQITRILNQHNADVKRADLCRKHGISDATFYNWKSKFTGWT